MRTKYKELKETNGTRREIDMPICDPEMKKMYIVDLTLRAPKDEKIDDITNLQLSLQRRGVLVEPMIITKDYAGETKKNVQHVRILDYEDLQSIINKMRTGNIQEIKKIVAGIT
ncbi:MAG: hypothetical protein QXV57_04180 [Thermoproteota archaeon]